MIVNTKRIYETPDVDIVELACMEPFLAASAGADLPGVAEDELDFEF